MIDKYRNTISGIYGLVIVLFFFPLMSSTSPSISISGIDFIFGKKINGFDIGFMFAAVDLDTKFAAVLLLSIVGVVTFLWRDRRVHYIQASIGVVGLSVLLMVLNTFRQLNKLEGVLSTAKADNESMLGLYLIMLLLTAAVVLSIYAISSAQSGRPGGNLPYGEKVDAYVNQVHNAAGQAKEHLNDLYADHVSPQGHMGGTAYAPPHTIILRPVGSGLPTISLASGTSTLVGRTRSATVQINDPHVSGRHLELQLDEQNRVAVRDLASTNGTYIDGRKLDPNSSHTLHRGERLVIGSEDVVYML